MDLKKFNDAGEILQELDKTLGQLKKIRERKNYGFIYFSLYSVDNPSCDDCLLSEVSSDTILIQEIQKLVEKRLIEKKESLQEKFSNI